MRNLVDYFYSHLNDENNYFTDIDISDRILKFEKGFEEFAGDMKGPKSKELIEDIVFLTYMDKKGKVAYIGASTLSNSDILMRIPEIITDLKFDDSGINIYVTVKNESFLGYKIYYSKKEGTTREVGVFNLMDYKDKLGKNPLTVFENLEDSCILAYNSDGTIYLTDYDFNLILDVTDEAKGVVREEVGEKYSIELGLYSYDLIGVRVLDNSIDINNNFFADNLYCTYIYSVSKNELLQRLPDGVNVNKIFNIDSMKNYANNSFVWITKSLFEWKDEYNEWLKEGQGHKIQKLMKIQAETTVNGLVPLYNIKDEDDFFYNSFTPMSTNAYDIGEYIEGLQKFYTVDNNDENSPFRYTYNFYSAKDNKITVEKIQSNTIPKKIYFNKDTSVATFQYKVTGFDQIVSYWKDYGDIVKYSKILIKDKGLEAMRKVVNDIETHLTVINGGNISATEDEIALLNNLINNKEYYEDVDTTQLVSNHLVNLGSGDIGISIDNISYGQQGRVMTYKYKAGTIDFKKRVRMNGSLTELYEEEMKKLKETEETFKDQKEKIERDAKKGI